MDKGTTELNEIKKREYKGDDFKYVPEEIQKKIRKVILKKLFPAILAHMKAKKYCKLRGIKIKHIPFKFLCSYRGSLEPAFREKEQYDLRLMKRYCHRPEEEFYIVYGKILAGAAIRISEFIGKLELKDELEEIVRDCFIPDKHPRRNAYEPVPC